MKQMAPQPGRALRCVSARLQHTPTLYSATQGYTIHGIERVRYAYWIFTVPQVGQSLEPLPPFE